MGWTLESARCTCPVFSQPLSLVVIAELGQQPLLLLTTLAVTGSRKSLWRVVESYLARWRVEEANTLRKAELSPGRHSA